MKPAVDLFSEYGLRAWTGTAVSMPQAHRHHDLELNYVVRGTMSYLISGKLVTLPPRRLCALWGGVPHQSIKPEFTPELIWVTVPMSQVLTWKLPKTLIGRLLREGLVMERDEHPGDRMLLRQWIDDFEGPRRNNPPPATMLEMEARLWRMGFAPSPTENSHAEDEKIARDQAPLLPRAVELLARFIAAHYREAVSMDDAARAAHVHPHYAMRIFRKHTNMTLHQYLTLQRVAHAQRLLVTTERTIIDIAFESGFQSVSRFYEAFKKQLGLSPRGYRLRVPRHVRGA